MTDILIQGLSPAVLTKIDDEASKRGLSRNQFLLESIQRPYVEDTPHEVTAADFERLAILAADLADPEIMAEAWR